jgi:hypothetical protein
MKAAGVEQRRHGKNCFSLEISAVPPQKNGRIDWSKKEMKGHKSQDGIFPRILK